MAENLFGGGGFGSSRKRRESVQKFNESAHNLIEKKKTNAQAVKKVSTILQESVVSEMGNAVLMSRSKRSVGGRKLQLKNEATDFYLKQGLFMLFNESLILDDEFKDGYSQNLYKLMESTLGYMFNTTTDFRKSFDKTLLLEDIKVIAEEVAELVCESYDYDKIPLQRNKLLEERVFEELGILESDNDEDHFDDCDDKSREDILPASSVCTGPNKMVPDSIEDIQDELEPEDPRIINDSSSNVKKLCENYINTFNEKVIQLLENYNTPAAIQSKVVKIIKAEMVAAEKEKEIFNNISQKIGANQQSSDVSGITPYSNQHATTSSEEPTPEQGPVDNTYDNLPNDGNVPKDPVAKGDNYSIMESANLFTGAYKQRKMGTFNNGISKPSLFKSIQIGLYKSNQDILSESANMQDNLFAEAISYYTLLEAINHIRLFEFKNDSDLRHFVTDKLSNVF